MPPYTARLPRPELFIAARHRTTFVLALLTALVGATSGCGEPGTSPLDPALSLAKNSKPQSLASWPAKHLTYEANYAGGNFLPSMQTLTQDPVTGVITQRDIIRETLEIRPNKRFTLVIISRVVEFPAGGGAGTVVGGDTVTYTGTAAAVAWWHECNEVFQVQFTVPGQGTLYAQYFNTCSAFTQNYLQINTTGNATWNAAPLNGTGSLYPGYSERLLMQ